MHGKFASFLRGIYFIRFPLSLWLFLLSLGPLDYFTGAARFTRGILTPESAHQAVTTSFMVISVGMIILLLVRIIAVNGDERFETLCKDKDGKLVPTQTSWLRRHLGQPHLGFGLFLAAHIPGAVLLGFVGKNIMYEITDGPKVVLAALLLGILPAYLFWLFVGLIYYWTFDANTSNPVPSEVIFPRLLIPLHTRWIKELQASPPPLLPTLLYLPFLAIARLGKEGYARPEDPDRLYEGHRLAFIAFVGLAVLYIFFFSFTAPVPLTVPYLTNITHAVAVFVVAFTLVGCAFGGWPKESAARFVKLLAIGLLAALLAELIYLWVAGIAAPRGFSVLGSVLILITGIFWILATLAFALDGTRLPILSFFVVGLLFLKGCAPYPAEHYFTAVTRDTHFDPALTPGTILDNRLAKAPQKEDGDYPPLIVITAEGGGIHSAAWTANVLAELENTFRDQQAGVFHAQILLASGVSGGSVGLLPFLREYTDREQPFRPRVKNSAGQVISDPVRDRLTRATDCSSLQAIAWGLSYYDILNFLSPLPLHNLSGVAAQGALPTGLDRSWALERSLARNLSDKGCKDDPTFLPGELAPPYQLTLSSTADLLKRGNMPAFTFNTTAAETGGRYLLSNYELPVETPSPVKLGTDLLPAESFLHTFGHDKTGQKPSDPQLYADLPLATAARLSATFPYISSASRVPKQVSTRGLHFIDGGYYDNDGTASAMEFLYFALQDSKFLPQPTSQDPSKVTHGRRLPILLIEIRNDPDISSNQSPESFAAQNNPDRPVRWGPDDQLVAPLEGFYQAGHASDTFRNRRELCIFEKAVQDRLDIHHVIFDYRNPDDRHQPLSWDLTPNQEKNIACAIDPTNPKCLFYTALKKQEPPGHTIHDLAQHAAEWFRDPAQTRFKDETCKATGLDTVPGS